MKFITKLIFKTRLRLLKPSSNLIYANAKRALTDLHFPSKSGLCQMWVRLVVKESHGDIFGTPNPANAKAAAARMVAKGYSIALGSTLQVGDLLYKTTGSGGNGHVAIYMGNGMVAENSSIHYPDDQDARGLRTLAEFGHYDVIIRLPEKK